MKRTHGIIRSLASAALAATTLAAALPRSADAASPTIRRIYTTTARAFDAWNPGVSPAPARTAAFASGVKIIAIYFAYRGAHAKQDQYQITIVTTGGAAVSRGKVHLFPYKNGESMIEFQDGSTASGVFPNGAYRARVLVNGHVGGSSTFSVGR